MSISEKDLEDRIFKFGSEIFQEIGSASGSYLNPQFYTDKFLEWAMEDEEVKVSLFRFVDVLPSLPDSASVIRHVQEYFRPLQGRVPGLLLKALEISPHSLTARVVSRAIQQQIRYVAARFILGETPEKALPRLQKMRRNKMAFTVDLVGEASVSEAEGEVYSERYLELLNTLSEAAPRWQESSPIIQGHRAENSPVNVSIKLSALYSQAKPQSEERSVEEVIKKVAPLLRRAKELGAFVYFDMEDTSLTNITLRAFKTLLSQSEFADYPHCGIVLQAYLRRTEEDISELLSWLKSRETPIAVRLVKGAYWDTETVLAMQKDWPIPVWQRKSCSDANFEKLSRILLQNNHLILPAFASHNIRSLSHAIVYAESLGLSPRDFELQTLYGMGEEFKQAFVDRGYLVREYAPIGELIPGMGYLVRRLLENTSNEGFVRKSLHDHIEPATLLAPPEFDPSDTASAYLSQRSEQAFHNEPLLDYSFAQTRSATSHSIEKLRQTASSNEVLPLIAGATQECSEHLISTSPEDPGLELAKVGLADPAMSEEALLRLKKFFPTWAAVPVRERADLLRDTANILRKRRHDFIAAAVLEAGKPWLEADADVAEAIDFLDYYAAEAERICVSVSTASFPGERNSYFYEPRGVSLVISPWNFPIAIPCGMFAASLVCGNTTILKPAEQTSLCASLLFEAFLEAGMPPEAAAFLPGRGEEIGPVLSKHPLVSTIVFTGSREVGLELIKTGASYHSEHVKRVIAEMGGKNAIIIDDDAELDEAVKGTLYSAFGFQGQKCSACSRLIVVGGNYGRILERLAEGVKSLPIAAASEPSCYVGPVIDNESKTRLLATIEHAKKDCTLLAQGAIPASCEGHYVPPTIFSGVPKKHSILKDELFGPVLAVTHVDTFEDALAEALDSEYALTGGLFSRSPRNIAKAAEAFNVGNLYINRPCTGAIVGRQPFGGAKMSGVGSKAGGPDYLYQFLIPRTLTENTMRRGFVPDL